MWSRGSAESTTLNQAIIGKDVQGRDRQMTDLASETVFFFNPSSCTEILIEAHFKRLAIERKIKTLSRVFHAVMLYLPVWIISSPVPIQMHTSGVQPWLILSLGSSIYSSVTITLISSHSFKLFWHHNTMTSQFMPIRTVPFSARKQIDWSMPPPSVPM